ncbi:MAG: ATP-binding protein [Candidatus Altimarinota bacterium]
MSISLPITVDKSHLITIGEKLYQEGVELIRELVCNAYDADAMNVWVEIEPYQIKVRDDGSGMDLSGLKQYLTIGSEEKINNSTSPKFGRQRIGQFGIGKFSVFSAAEVFKVTTQKDGFAGQLVFDRLLWRELENWNVPVHERDFDPMLGNGTTVTLERIKKTFSTQQVEKAIRERTPLKARHFQVFLNGKKVEPYHIPGKNFPVHEETEFGIISGTIIIPHFSQKIAEPGIEITVKGVMIRRETFGLEHSHPTLANRITGSIAADFLPVTSDRGRFIIDSDPYFQFQEAMSHVIRGVIRNIKEEQQIKADKKADKVLREAMRSMRKALRRNDKLAPFTGSSPVKDSLPSDTLLGMSSERGQDSNVSPSTPDELFNRHREHQGLQPAPQSSAQKEPKVRQVRVKMSEGRILNARKIQVGSLDIACSFVDLGEDSPEHINENGVIIINSSHKMYRRVQKKEELLTEYILRLIAQELSRQHSPYDSAKAFELMNELLRDAV